MHYYTVNHYSHSRESSPTGKYNTLKESLHLNSKWNLKGLSYVILSYSVHIVSHEICLKHKSRTRSESVGPMRTAQPRSQGRDSGFHYKTPNGIRSHAAYPAKLMPSSKWSESNQCISKPYKCLGQIAMLVMLHNMAGYPSEVSRSPKSENKH